LCFEGLCIFPGKFLTPETAGLLRGMINNTVISEHLAR
jgi:hypothetical protein